MVLPEVIPETEEAGIFAFAIVPSFQSAGGRRYRYLTAGILGGLDNDSVAFPEVSYLLADRLALAIACVLNLCSEVERDEIQFVAAGTIVVHIIEQE